MIPSELVLASLLSGGKRLYQQRLGLFLGTAGPEYPVDPGPAVPVYGQLGQLCVLWATWRWMDGSWALIGFSWGS